MFQKLRKLGLQMHKILKSLLVTSFFTGIYFLTSGSLAVVLNNINYTFEIPKNIDSTGLSYCCNEWNFSNGDILQTRRIELNYSNTPQNIYHLFDPHRTYVYPNPSTGDILRVRIQVEFANHIECKIYDLAGFFIDKLILDNPTSKMPNEIIWNVSDVESGIYYIDLTAKGNNKTQTKLIKAGIVH